LKINRYCTSLKELGSSFQQASKIMSGISTDKAVSTLKFNTGLRGYHAYRTSWKPFLKQQLTFKQEKDNKHDRFAVAGETILPGTIFPSSVGHIPIELNRYISIVFGTHCSEKLT